MRAISGDMREMRAALDAPRRSARRGMLGRGAIRRASAAGSVLRVPKQGSESEVSPRFHAGTPS
jgi:hypothetical protein